MGDFKEWLSDNLRYFLVGVVVILIIGGSILGLKIYSSAVNGRKEPEVIQKVTETSTETQSESERAESETETKPETEAQTESEKESETQTESQTQDVAGNLSQNGSESENTYEEPVYQAPPQTEAPQTEPPQTEPPQPVYMTINSACYMRSYADYGDNIIGQFEAGTTVQFLEDVGGWYKVSVNGQTGYIGARFFN